MPIGAKADPFLAAVTRNNLLGADLLAARKRLGLTVTAQASRIGISVTLLNGCTSSTGNPSRSTVNRALTWLAANR